VIRKIFFGTNFLILVTDSLEILEDDCPENQMYGR